MGYGATLHSGWKTTKRYQELLKNAYGIEDSRGTSAVVYTQLTDVEQELNGLLTYDRAVIKPDGHRRRRQPGPVPAPAAQPKPEH